MSRMAQHPKTASAARLARPVASKQDPGAPNAQDEICPVCKSSRYLNANLRFLVNPECYHKMCESCVDRIFSHGPAPCPLPGCGRTLRKHRFREQTFEDIKVEREVDIRRRVAAVFNKEEDDFEDLRSYNDYLNEVEDITFNLVNNIDYEANNAKLEQYEKAQIEEEQDEEGTAKQGVQLKRRLDKNAAAERKRKLNATEAAAAPTIKGIKGLKAVKAPVQVEVPPVDPFGGLKLSAKYYEQQPNYVWDGIQAISKDAVILSGGYDVNTFAVRALSEAFAGLGVFVDSKT